MIADQEKVLTEKIAASTAMIITYRFLFIIIVPYPFF